MRELCEHSRALTKVIKNTRAENAAVAQVRRFIERGGLLPRRIVVFEGNKGGSDAATNE